MTQIIHLKNGYIQNDLYTSRAVPVGIWEDGKTIYKRIVKLTTGSTVNTWYTLLYDNVDMPIKISNIFTKTNQHYTNDPYFKYYAENGKINYSFTDAWRANAQCVFIVEYTKK